ncbi:MAG: DUF2156 domain-containing protein [Acidimicrobiaceae bacterium]|nr:DUF2156 domain-containing protein [Acidimicrobiaceae bacterium]
MSLPPRLTVRVPYGHRVVVLSDLHLTPRTSPNSRPVREVVTLLGDYDDPTTLVVAGGLFRLDGSSPAKALEATFARLADLHRALRDFRANDRHRVVVLVGTGDEHLEDPAVQSRLFDLGIEITREVALMVDSESGSRELLVTTGQGPRMSGATVRSDSESPLIEDPAREIRFATSRTLYRRFAPAIWLVLALVIGVDFLHSLLQLITHFTHHVYRVHVRPLHARGFWGGLLVNAVVLVGAEALVVALAGFVVSRRFDRRQHLSGVSEPLTTLRVGALDALDVARRVVASGGLGAVVGGAARPALAFLDRGVCATPGPSREVWIEREGRFALPSVFTPVERVGIIEVEAARDVQVRLLGGQSRSARARPLERLVAGSPFQPAPPEVTSPIGQWPGGAPFPLALERLADQRRQRSVRRWSSGLILVAGLIDVVTTVSTPLRNRLSALRGLLPLGVAQGAAVLTALAGVALIMLARGVRRGQRRAWAISALALGITVVAHLARGGALPTSLIAASLGIFLLIERRHFRASADRSSLPSAVPLLASVAVLSVVAGAVSVEASAHGRVLLPNFGRVLLACAERLFGIYTIALPDKTTDFVDPVLLTIGISLVVVVLYLLTRPVVDRRLSSLGPARVAERRVAERRARDIVRRHGRGTLDYFALRDDKQFYFFRDSLVAYAVYGGVALVSPDPIGPEAERIEVFSAFRTYAESRGWSVAITGAGADWLSLYHAAGMHSIYIGDEAIVDTTTFSLDGGKMKGLRQAYNRVGRHGYQVQFLDPAEIDPAHVQGVLDLISMLRRGEGERGFSMMLGRLFDPKDRGLLLALVTGPDGRPAAALQFVPSPAIQGYSLDLMRRDPGEHPNGLIDFALVSTIFHLRDQGAKGLSLNFAAFRSVLDGERGEGAFTRVERWTLRRLSGILPIESLWAFNAKYDPDWLPRYLVYPAAEQFVPVVMAILRAESLTEIPVVGRLLANDPANRPGTVVPEEVLAAARDQQSPELDVREIPEKPHQIL